jgi:hypothetical protein
MTPMLQDSLAWKPVGRYMAERRQEMAKCHLPARMTLTEGHILDWMVSQCDTAFAWDEQERGSLRTDAFLLVKIATVPHTPWREKSQPIVLGLFDRVCEMIKSKINTGVYKPLNLSYSSQWFCMLKKDSSSL